MILQKRFLAVLVLVAIIVSICGFSGMTDAATLLSDDFTGTTINTAKWAETDGGGIGGTTGNMQQNGALSMTGSAAWGGNYLVTQSTYDRSAGGLEMEADVTCGSGSSIFGIGYGDPGVLSGGGESYTLYAVSNSLYFSRQLANGNAENFSNIGSCPTGTPVHIRITIGTTTGALVYLDGSGTPAATAVAGTFNNKGFFLSGHSGTATLVDNVAINGAGVATAPDAPTGLTTTPSSTQMGLTWTAPLVNGGAAITDYIVEYKLASEPTTWTTFSDGTSTTPSTTVTGLTNGLSYNFRVSAVNSVGTGSPSTTATATPALSVPTAPQTLSASSGVSGQSVLTWSAPVSNGGASVTDYTVEYKLSTEPTTWTTFSDGTSTSTGATVTGLTNGLTYNFRVKAVNSVGTSVASNTANATPNTYSFSDNFTGTTIDTGKWVEADAGGGTGGTTGNVQQNGTLNISGNSAWGSNMLRTVTTYIRDDGDVTAAVDVTIANCGGSDTMALSYGGHLTSNSTYFAYYNGGKMNFAGFTPGEVATISPDWSCTNNVPFNLKMVIVQAGGAQLYIDNVLKGTITSGTYTGTFALQGFISGVVYDNFYITEPVTGPDAPTSLNATAGDAQVGLTWTPGADNGAAITDYVIEYKLASSGSWSTFADGTSATAAATVTGLTNGLSYNFRVSAVNSNGTGNESSAATAMPVSATPLAPIATSVSISGNAAVDELLTGTYTFADPNGNSQATSTYRWLRADTAGGVYTPISGATSSTYTVAAGDLSKYIKFEVTPVASVAPTTGSPVLSLATAQIASVNYLNQILSTGQSLSVGVAASPALSTTQPYSNKMLSGGAGGIGTGSSFIPLVESSVETMSSSIANSLTFNDPGNDLDTVMSLHGVSGFIYSQLKKGTGPYAAGMTQVTNAKSAATALGRTSRVLGVTNIHGETDNFNGVSGATYQGYLEEWQNDYDTDVKAITGQSNEVPLFIDQMSSFMSSYASDATSEIPIYQLYAAQDNPGEIVLVAPKYFFNYSDRHHLTNTSSRWLGEYHAKVIKKVSIDHEAWRPLSPDSAVRNGNMIYADFHVPAGVLAFDTTLVSPRTNKGFEYFDSTSSATITAVDIIDADTVRVTLSGTPTGANQRLRYAYTGVPGTDTGAQNAGTAAGNLRDTDPYPSLYGSTLYNWAVHFDQAITTDTTAPNISGVSSTPSGTAATITWSTNEASSSIVDYGLTTSYGTSTSETDIAPRVTSHSVPLSGLVSCTTYHYRVRSKDAVLNTATGTDNTFTTTGCTGSATVNAQNETPITTASGGTATLTSGPTGIELDIPSGATGSNAIYQIKSLDQTTVFTSSGTPGGVIPAGSYAFDLKALTGVGTAVTSFSSPIEITITYQDSDVSGIVESSLVIYRYDGSAWHALTGCVVDTALNTITCQTSNFSVFSLFGTAPVITSSGSGGKAGASYKLPVAPKLALSTACPPLALFDPMTGAQCAKSTSVIAPPAAATVLFTKNLSLGVTHAEVKALQKYLNAQGYLVTKKGSGSKGYETSYFGPATKAALIRFQKAKGIKPASGNFGQVTRTYIETH